VTARKEESRRVAQCRYLIRCRRIISGGIDTRFLQLPVWDMLLELYLAHHEQRDVYLGSLCMVVDTALATAYRRIMDMQKHGLVDRTYHSQDRRRIQVRISSTGIASMDAIMDAIESPG